MEGPGRFRVLWLGCVILTAGAWGGVGLQDSRPAPAGQSLGCLAQAQGLFLGGFWFWVGAMGNRICVMLLGGTS